MSQYNARTCTGKDTDAFRAAVVSVANGLPPGRSSSYLFLTSEIGPAASWQR
jgi:hypothetical protein